METLRDLSGNFTIIISLLGVMFGIIGLMRLGSIKKLKFGNFSIEGNEINQNGYSEIINSFKKDDTGNIPFEIEQLAKYYTQILYQTKISFWFSIIFASLGFLIIVLIIFTNAEISSAKSIVSLSTSIIIEAVSALFFTRSNKAQKEMEDFFNKLRKDRQHSEARKLIESLSNTMIKDIAKVQIALKYSDIENNTDMLNEMIKEAVNATLKKN